MKSLFALILGLSLTVAARASQLFQWVESSGNGFTATIVLSDNLGTFYGTPFASDPPSQYVPTVLSWNVHCTPVIYADFGSSWNFFDQKWECAGSVTSAGALNLQTFYGYFDMLGSPPSPAFVTTPTTISFSYFLVSGNSFDNRSYVSTGQWLRVPDQTPTLVLLLAGLALCPVFSRRSRSWMRAGGA
jgi:hypothetical protein